MLWLIDIVGGLILLIIFGTKAWESATTEARVARLTVGSFGIGVFLVILSHNYYPNMLSWAGSSRELVEWLIAPGLVVLVLLLELLRRKVVNKLFI
jgi:hypothetical protein